MSHLFLPAFTLGARRYRPRVRLCGGLRLARRLDAYPEGEVWRYWVGPLLVTVMVD